MNSVHEEAEDDDTDNNGHSLRWFGGGDHVV